VSQYFKRRQEAMEILLMASSGLWLSHALVHQYYFQESQYFKHRSETMQILLVTSSGLMVSVMLLFMDTALR
jgi:hypothetical protein